MDELGSATIVVFEGFRLDSSGGGLFRLDPAGIATPVSISSRALDLPSLLVERQGQLVPKDAIMEAVWPGMVVDEGNLTVQISALRRILDENRKEGSCIQTVSGRGYRFIAPVMRAEPATRPESAPSSGNGSGRPIVEGAKLQGPVTLGRTPASIRRARQGRRVHVIAAVIGALCLVSIVVAGIRWQRPWSGETRPAPRLSMLVLPFTNLSDNREQQYFADAITEDLTTDLSRIAPMFVISYRTAFGYRDGASDVKQIGRELGVRYVVEGSVHRSGHEVRVSSSLAYLEHAAGRLDPAPDAPPRHVAILRRRRRPLSMCPDHRHDLPAARGVRLTWQNRGS